MDATRRCGLVVSMLAGLAALAGCSAAPEMAMAPQSPAGTVVTAGFTSAPMEPAQAEAPSPSPSPAPRDAPDVPARSAKKAEESRDKDASNDRPGLGTEWGETRLSGITIVPFDRAEPSSPFASLAIAYNDKEGAKATAEASRRSAGSFEAAGGLVTVAIRDEGGRSFAGFVSGQRDYVIGEAGRRYTIALHNNTSHRFEAVLSVDGLDVRDGQAAAFGKRGYILEARADLEIDGFRQSAETVAAFRFGSVRGSYAGQKYGDTRNVGVIGLALFHEHGADESVWTPEEIQRRRSANPFPGQWATPVAN